MPTAETNLLKEMSLYEPSIEKQWALEVNEYSSQYGSEGSLSYSVKNLAHGIQRYPAYGDFTEAAVWVWLKERILNRLTYNDIH